MNEPHMAPWWFPANDHPRDKARWTSASRSRGQGGHRQRALGSGASVRGDLATVHWRARRADGAVPRVLRRRAPSRSTGRSRGMPWYVAVSKRAPTAAAGRDDACCSGRRPIIAGWRAARRLSVLDDRRAWSPASPRFRAGEPDPPHLPRLGPGRRRWWCTSSRTSGSATRSSVRTGATSGSTRARDLHGGPVRPRRTAGGPRTTWLRDSYDEHRRATRFWDLRIGDPGAAPHLRRPRSTSAAAMALQALRNRIGDADFWTLLRTWVRERRRRQRLDRGVPGAGRGGQRRGPRRVLRRLVLHAAVGPPTRPPTASAEASSAQPHRQAGHAALELLELGRCRRRPPAARAPRTAPRSAARRSDIRTVVAAEEHDVRPRLLRAPAGTGPTRPGRPRAARSRRPCRRAAR